MSVRKLVLPVLVAMSIIGCGYGPASHVSRGNKLFAQGKYDNAELEYRSAIKKNPAYSEAYYRMALVELRLKRFPLAYSFLKQSVDLNPRFRPASVEFGDLAWLNYKASKASIPYNDLSQVSERLLAANPKDLDGLRFKAYIAIADKRADDAIGLLQAANSLHPQDPDVVLPMVELLTDKGQSAEAEKLLRQLIAKEWGNVAAYDVLYEICMREKRIQDAETVLRLRVDKNPKDAFALIRLADFYASQKNTAGVNATLQRLRDGRASIPGARAVAAAFYFNHQLFDQAVGEYQQAIKEDPKNEIAYRKRMEGVLVAQGKNDEARAEIEKILKHDPKDTDALLLKADFDMKSGQKSQINEAAGIYKGLSTERPNDPGLRFYYARALMAKGDPQSARAELSEALRKRPASVAPRLELAELALRDGKDLEALRLADEVLEQNPSNRRARLLRATAEEGAGQTVGARADLDQVLRDQPGDEDAQLQLALLDLADKRFQQASVVFAKYYHPGQKDLRPLEGLVRTEIKQGQFDKALTLLDDEVKRAPQSATLRMIYAATAIQAHKVDIARAQYQALAAQNQDSGDIELQWGEVLEMTGDPQGAGEHYRKAVALDPKNSTAPFLLGRILAKTGHQPEALASYRAAVKADPNNILALNNLAYSLAQSGQDLDEALRMALNAQKLRADNPDIADTVGLVYLKKGQTGSALQVFENNVKKYPKIAAFHYHLGAALLANGDKTKAKEELQKALESNPPSSEEPNIRKLLARIG
jgi:tetratricopeptide (TPR) repeat protein